MNSHMLLVSLAVGVFYSSAAPIVDNEAKHSKRDLQQVLKEAAETAETIGKNALKFVLPEIEQSGANILKPLLTGQRPKRSISYQQPQTGLNFPYYNPVYNQRGAIPYAGNPYVGFYQWNSNPVWNMPYQRSVAPFAQQPYYQQAQLSSSQNPNSLNRNEAADEKATKDSLKDFQKLIANVDSALLSFNDKSGVELSESLTGVDKDTKKLEMVKKSKKRSKMTKKQAKNELKRITKTFTDFICGDQC